MAEKTRCPPPPPAAREVRPENEACEATDAATDATAAVGGETGETGEPPLLDLAWSDPGNRYFHAGIGAMVKDLPTGGFTLAALAAPTPDPSPAPSPARARVPEPSPEPSPAHEPEPTAAAFTAAAAAALNGAAETIARQQNELVVSAYKIASLESQLKRVVQKDEISKSRMAQKLTEAVVKARESSTTPPAFTYLLKLDVDPGAAWDKVFELAAAAAAATAAAPGAPALGTVHHHYQTGIASLRKQREHVQQLGGTASSSGPPFPFNSWDVAMPPAPPLHGHLPHMTLKYNFEGTDVQIAALCNALDDFSAAEQQVGGELTGISTFPGNKTVYAAHKRSAATIEMAKRLMTVLRTPVEIPLATENLPENTVGVLHQVPHQCSLGAAACYLPFMLTCAILMCRHCFKDLSGCSGCKLMLQVHGSTFNLGACVLQLLLQGSDSVTVAVLR